MGLEINYWDCKFSDYVEDWDGENEIRLYNCTNKEGCGTCNLNNKGGNQTSFCEIAKTKL